MVHLDNVYAKHIVVGDLVWRDGDAAFDDYFEVISVERRVFNEDGILSNPFFDVIFRIGDRDITYIFRYDDKVYIKRIK